MRPSPYTQKKSNYGLIYKPNYLSLAERKKTIDWLKTLRPLWEERFSKNNPPPQGQEQRRLLRPVYWLGNWQFACLNYYHPPAGIRDRCVQAEPFPDFMQNIVQQIEGLVFEHFQERDIPQGWHLNTCLVNFYGSQKQGDKAVDVARVGEHKDFEPGPVASLSLGERALFQFVNSAHRGARSEVVLQQWLEDSSLQVFGGDKFKKKLFHRVQRVETKKNERFAMNVEGFEVRRINFTFRYVPNEHIVPYASLNKLAQEDIQPYVQELAKNSEFFKFSLLQS